ncbi:hypothetical protein [Variovorax sp. N23]|uniref:hypothetical protein n=1 Tax=Variovorax sp. N23 TaxID=2980555 RepID=UPI0021C8DB58|nr:hypothetical protein [Variovorax sp. N23]MCU4119808.1 hypothetical protein [Variovorax sp. N23]
MAQKTCFVVMAIGDQLSGEQQTSSADLKSKYDNLIKEAILKARPNLEVVRADEVSLPGTITTDIVSRLMHSDYVIADVSHPNPNVFYELGLRHACKCGTIIIKDKNAPRVPFDIAHLRYVEYENTTAGLKNLSHQLSAYFDHFDKNPEKPDNHFQEFAKLTSYSFPNYKKEDEAPLEMQAIMGLMESPELLDMIIKQQSGTPINDSDLIGVFMKNPKVAQPFFQAMIQSGEISFPKPAAPKRIPRKRK